MLRYSSLGAKIILGLVLALAALAAYLPFLEAFALTPAIAFIHRFSVTINVGDDTKTLQPIIFVIPILLIKGLWEYHKKHNIKKLLTSKLTLVVGLMVIADLISLATSTNLRSSLGTFLVHGVNLAIFATSCVWLSLTSELMQKPALQKIGIALTKTFAIALIGFTVVNTFVSITQFIDCSFSGRGCVVWSAIDEFFPNKLLTVGHQKFSYKPIIARSPGFFGDVNFNGMFSLFIVLLSGAVWLFVELLRKHKGYDPSKEQRLLLVPIVAGIISFTLTLSRSAILGAGILGLVIFFVIHRPHISAFGFPVSLRKKLLAGITIGMVSLVALVALGYAIPLTSAGRTSTLSAQIVQYAVEMVSPKEDSAQGHASLFLEAVKIGNQNPLVGMGMGTFGVQYQKVIAPLGGVTASPHSTYGLLYAEQGFIGIVLYGIMIIILWHSAIQQGRRFAKNVLTTRQANNKITREEYLVTSAQLLFVLVAFGIPFFSVATISYYGFFLPMTWWWGNGGLLLKN
jgi:hypothetical protein